MWSWSGKKGVECQRKVEVKDVIDSDWKKQREIDGSVVCSGVKLLVSQRNQSPRVREARRL